MRLSRAAISALLVCATFALPVLAQNTQPAKRGTSSSSSDRLFLSFAEDATVVENQWWEGQIDHSSADVRDVTALRGIFAIQPWDSIELGGRVGFGTSDSAGPDGSGATDLDVWGKYHFGSGSSNTEFAVGGLITVPTGDDTAGLGYDAFAFEAFGSMRQRFDAWVLSVQAGLQVSDDGSIGGAPLNSETSPFLGAGAIVPMSDRVSLVGEAIFRGERFETATATPVGLGSDSRILGGVNWRPANRGIVRAAISVGLSDGAPDVQVILGYAANF